MSNLFFFGQIHTPFYVYRGVLSISPCRMQDNTRLFHPAHHWQICTFLSQTWPYHSPVIQGHGNLKPVRALNVRCDRSPASIVLEYGFALFALATAIKLLLKRWAINCRVTTRKVLYRHYGFCQEGKQLIRRWCVREKKTAVLFIYSFTYRRDRLQRVIFWFCRKFKKIFYW